MHARCARIGEDNGVARSPGKKEGLRHEHAMPRGRNSTNQHHTVSRGSRWTSTSGRRPTVDALTPRRVESRSVDECPRREERPGVDAPTPRHVERKPIDERPRRKERPKGDVPASRRVERRSMDKPQWGEAER